MPEIKGTLKRKNASNDQTLTDILPETDISCVRGYETDVASKLAGNTVRQTDTWFSTNNPTLLSGQYGIETNTGYAKVGDGTTAWNQLPYISSPNAVANMTIEIDEGTGYETQMNGAMYLEVYNEQTGQYEVVAE